MKLNGMRTRTDRIELNRDLEKAMRDLQDQRRQTRAAEMLLGKSKRLHEDKERRARAAESAHDKETAAAVGALQLSLNLTADLLRIEKKEASRV